MLPLKQLYYKFNYYLSDIKHYYEIYLNLSNEEMIFI